MVSGQVGANVLVFHIPIILLKWKCISILILIIYYIINNKKEGIEHSTHLFYLFSLLRKIILFTFLTTELLPPCPFPDARARSVLQQCGEDGTLTAVSSLQPPPRGQQQDPSQDTPSLAAVAVPPPRGCLRAKQGVCCDKEQPGHQRLRGSPRCFSKLGALPAPWGPLLSPALGAP